MQENEVATVLEPVKQEEVKIVSGAKSEGVNVRRIGVTFENEQRLEVIEMDNASIVIAKEGLTVYAGSSKAEGGNEAIIALAFNEIKSGEKTETGKSQFIASSGSNVSKGLDYMSLHNGVTLLLHRNRITISTSSRNSLTEIHPGTGIVTIPIKEASMIISLN